MSVKNHSEVDKVSYESARQTKEDQGPVAFKKLDDERVHTSPYIGENDVGTSRLKGKKESTHPKLSKGSAVPMNPVSDNQDIDIKQTSPKKS